MRYKFVFSFPGDRPSNQSPSKVTVESDTETTEELLSIFEDFLKGTGHHFDGHVDIVKDEE